MNGRVVAIGTGPGDPELVTVKAIRWLQSADLVAYVHAKSRPSRARATMATHLRPGTAELAVPLDMGPDRRLVDAAYDDLAGAVRAAVAEGRTVAVLCEGDPLLFGSFVYLLERLDGVAVELVPGIASPQAAAAAAGWVLATGNKGFAILPAPLGSAQLRRRLALVEAAAIVKIGRHLDDVRHLLDELGLLDDAWLAVEVSTAEQRLAPLRSWPEATAPYFALVLTRGLGQADA